MFLPTNTYTTSNDTSILCRSVFVRYSMEHSTIGIADIAPRFRQMPTSSYQAITLILLMAKMRRRIKWFCKPFCICILQGTAMPFFIWDKFLIYAWAQKKAIPALEMLRSKHERTYFWQLRSVAFNWRLWLNCRLGRQRWKMVQVCEAQS